MADILIASRYIEGGVAIMPVSRRILSRIINSIFGKALQLHIHDISSGFRLYRRECIGKNKIIGKDFNILQEILVHAVKKGFEIKEIPFTYLPRAFGTSRARIIKLGLAYARTFCRLLRMRNKLISP